MIEIFNFFQHNYLELNRIFNIPTDSSLFKNFLLIEQTNINELKFPDNEQIYLINLQPKHIIVYNLYSENFVD
jgi:hypothetical protein